MPAAGRRLNREVVPRVRVVTDHLVDPFLDRPRPHQLTLEADAHQHVGIDAERTREGMELVGREPLRAPLGRLQIAPAHAGCLGHVPWTRARQLADGAHPGSEVFGLQLVSESCTRRASAPAWR